nr:hypothetical protein [Tanacetum cinerariifolium]
CQQVKIEHRRASGLLQQLDIPVWKWDEIFMDLVTGLPQTQRRHDAIWVVVDRLTKSAHFLPIRKDYSVSRLAEIFQQEIVRLHGTPSAIVSDRDPHFASRFWKGLQKAWGTGLKLRLSTSGLVTQRRHDAIWVVVDHLTKSVHFLPIRKDYSVSRLAKTFQQEIVRLHDTPSAIVSDRDPRFASRFWKGLQKAWGTRLKKCRALICWDQVGERVIEGPEMIEVTNKKVAVAKEKLKEARTRQKSYADKHHKSLEFQPGDHVFLESITCTWSQTLWYQGEQVNEKKQTRWERKRQPTKEGVHKKEVIDSGCSRHMTRNKCYLTYYEDYDVDLLPLEMVKEELLDERQPNERMEKAATTASSLEAEQDSGNINRTQSMATLNEPLPQGTGSGSGPRCQVIILGV